MFFGLGTWENRWDGKTERFCLGQNGGGRQKYWYVQGSTNTPPPLPFLDARRGGRVIPAGGKIGPAGGLLREGGGGVAGWRIRLFGRAWEWFSDLPACLCACLGAQNRDLGRGFAPGPWGGLSACLPGQLVWHVRRTAGGARGGGGGWLAVFGGLLLLCVGGGRAREKCMTWVGGDLDLGLVRWISRVFLLLLWSCSLCLAVLWEVITAVDHCSRSRSLDR